jgi:hypothetical protein
MISLNRIAVTVLVITLAWSFKVKAQVSQYVTLVGTTGGNNLPVQTNNIVSVVGYDWRAMPTISGNYQDGTTINMSPFLGTSDSALFGSQIPQIFTGLTSITVRKGSSSPGAATFQISTPANVTVVSNYVPADAIVIPASATGNVQIILESSADLVNWTAASPGTYGASSATNRFFRVRAVCN